MVATISCCDVDKVMELLHSEINGGGYLRYRQSIYRHHTMNGIETQAGALLLAIFLMMYSAVQMLDMSFDQLLCKKLFNLISIFFI